MPPIEVFQPFRPVLSAPTFDGGGYEVIGWIDGPRWLALRQWVKLLCDRNMHGTLAFDTNPEPWPRYYEGIKAVEVSHARRPWQWTGALDFFPFATAQQIWDVLQDLTE